MINKYKVPIGYSGHETLLAPSLAAVSIGASIIERHITMDRAMIGSDHAASLGPDGLWKLIANIKNIELIIISATPHNEINEIVEKKGLGKYFKLVCGSPKNKSYWIDREKSKSTMKQQF